MSQEKVKTIQVGNEEIIFLETLFIWQSEVFTEVEEGEERGWKKGRESPSGAVGWVELWSAEMGNAKEGVDWEENTCLVACGVWGT